jgi:hypothetical protein
MNQATLQTELSDDPLARGYAGMTDTERYASLTAEDRPSTTMRFASLRTLAAELTDEEYVTIKGVLTAVAASNVKVADMLSILATPGNDDGTGGGLDFGCDSVRGMIDAFVAGELITADLGAKIKAIAETTTSRAAELGIADVRLLDVIRAGRAIQ